MYRNLFGAPTARPRYCLAGSRIFMSAPSSPSYASVTHGNRAAIAQDTAPGHEIAAPELRTKHAASSSPSAHSGTNPTPAHVPRTSNVGNEVFVLTFLTDSSLHDKMTQLRKRYFPPKLNRLDAHLTLFHALPGSKLESDILPVLQETVGSTPAFRIFATTPYKLRHGIAIGVPKASGGDSAREIHRVLKSRWLDFLSTQDAGGFAAHYTIMNKVENDKTVDESLDELLRGWEPVKGEALGFSLWKYDRSRWIWQQDFCFAKKV